jgi:hypothetical protein
MIQSNCPGTPSWDLQGTGNIFNQLGNASVRTVGSVSVPGRVTPPGALITPVTPVEDPFRTFPRPPITNIVWNGPGPYIIPVTACNVATPLTPGTYVGGIKNDPLVTLGCDVYLGSGIFILKGGGFNQFANAGMIKTIGATQNNGAMIYNTNDNYPGTGSTCGPIVAQQGGGFDTWAMSPAASIAATGKDDYAGMALYQDRNCTNTIAIQSNGPYFFHGSLYAPTAALALTSQSPSTLYSQLVVSEIQMQAVGDLTVNYKPSESARSGLPSLVD